LAFFERVVHDAHGVGDHRRQTRRHLVKVLRGDVLGVEGRAVVDLGENQVLLVQYQVEFFTKDFRIEQVLHAKPHARGLVRVGRSDPALGGAECVLAQEPLGQTVEFLVIGHDQVGVS
jgi:hypothetical protein